MVVDALGDAVPRLEFMLLADEEADTAEMGGSSDEDGMVVTIAGGSLGDDENDVRRGEVRRSFTYVMDDRRSGLSSLEERRSWLIDSLVLTELPT